MFDKALVFTAKNKVVLIMAALAFAVVYPYVFTSPYFIRMGTVALMYVMLTLSLNLLTGVMGQMSFGHAAFWGIGAYTSAILAKNYHIGSEVTFILAMVIAGMFGFALGLPVLKLRGYYLSLVTFGFCEIIRLVELNEMALTRGPFGINNIPAPSFFGWSIATISGTYYLILVLVVLTTLVINSLINSRIGIALFAIRDDDIAAKMMGVNVFKYKVMTFTISAMFAGLAGAFYSQYIQYVDPSSFTTGASIEMLVMAIFGGLGSVIGSFVGAILLTIIPELMRGLMEYRLLIYGFLLVILMMARPQGIFGNISFRHISNTLKAAKEDKDNG